MTVLWIALGGAAGSVARFGVTLALARTLGPAFPYGTLAVNVAGSLILGALLAASESDPRISPEVRALIGTGFCGAFTTMSTFTVETLKLPLPQAVANVGANLGACLLAAWLAMRLVRALQG